MIVTAKFEDNTAFTSEDLRAALAHVFGDNLVFDVEPSDKSPEGRIKFGINELIAHRVLDIYHNTGEYEKEVAYLRLMELTQVIVDELIAQVIDDIKLKLEEG